MKKAEVVGLGLLAVIGAAVGYEVYRSNATTTIPASSSAPVSPTVANWTQAGYAYSGWSAPSAYSGSGVYSNANTNSLIGSGAGNQANGVYYLASNFSSASGSATLTFAADDAAVVYVDGVKVGSVGGCNLCSGKPTQVNLNITAGTHVVAVQVANNNGLGGGNGYVANGSGTPNPTGLYLSITQGSQTLVSTASASGWLMLAYPSTLLSPNAMSLLTIPAATSANTSSTASTATTPSLSSTLASEQTAYQQQIATLQKQQAAVAQSIPASTSNGAGYTNAASNQAAYNYTQQQAAIQAQIYQQEQAYSTQVSQQEAAATSPSSAVNSQQAALASSSTTANQAVNTAVFGTAETAGLTNKQAYCNQLAVFGTAQQYSAAGCP